MDKSPARNFDKDLYQNFPDRSDRVDRPDRPDMPSDKNNDILLADRYKFSTKSIIGRGSFSKVYVGTDITTNNKIAIKKMEIGNFASQMKSRVREEINIAQTLDHPNIVKTYDVVFSTTSDGGSVVYVIMEFCECGTFSRFLINSKMKETRARFFFNQLLEGLKYLQEKNIFHRDLKPDNLLLSDKHRILKIADFGFARYLDEGRMTETICGSRLYMAPEILFGESYTNKADLWSVGVILYQAIYSRHPYQATTHDELITSLKNKSIELPKNVHITPDCVNLICSLLKKNPAQRLSWQEFFTHPWLKHLQIDKRILKLKSTSPSLDERTAEVRASKAIDIGLSTTSAPISISVSPMSLEAMIVGYCSPSSPYAFNNSLEHRRPNVTQSDIIIPDRRETSASGEITGSQEIIKGPEGRGEMIVRVEKPINEKGDGYLTYAWSVISSSMKPLSVFRQ